MSKPTLNPLCSPDAHESGQANLRYEKPFSDLFILIMFGGVVGSVDTYCQLELYLSLISFLFKLFNIFEISVCS